MREKSTFDTLFVLRRMEEEHREKEKNLYMSFVDLEKAFDKSTKKSCGMGNERPEYQR